MASIPPAVAGPRARVASLSRSRSNDDPDLIAARRDLAAANLSEFIAKTLASAPPLSDDQRRRLAGLFAGGASQ